MYSTSFCYYFLSCFFFFFLIINLYLLIPADITEICIAIAKLTILNGIVPKNARAKIETYQVAVETKTNPQ